MAMGNLATTYSSLGKYNEALALHLEVLAFHRRVLPEDHPHIGRGPLAPLNASCRAHHTLTLSFVLWAGVVLGRLVSAYQDAGLYDEAVRTGQEAIQMMESNLTGLAALRSRMLGGNEVCTPAIL
jgi:hypothetical protein